MKKIKRCILTELYHDASEVIVGATALDAMNVCVQAGKGIWEAEVHK